MKKYSKIELSEIAKYFKKGKIPKSTFDMNQKLLNSSVNSDIKSLLNVAILKISKNEDISSIVDSIVLCEKELVKSNSTKNSLRSSISEKLMDDETLSKLQLKAIREVLNDSKETINFNRNSDIYNEYDENGELHHKIKK